ncbi:hypothetical protein HNP84_003142 [Thermocatellispora tengchongensis]|uniref:Uncharacterized protein n=1 Tax=Thermocatellispora tengchongensis TaxID=1073253 RepID=A0A840P4I6_9ACTN|nr:hypothetical protein [Thermocatellispora tengchongensis]MBB5133416.1 hypothetical protein [Thermocatellispora tengchongensis]
MSETTAERPSAYRTMAYSHAALARLNLSAQAAGIADAARDMVPTTADRHGAEGELVRDAASLVEAAGLLLEQAVVCERIKGTGWDRIADALGHAGGQAARERFERAERDFRLRALDAWLRPERAGEVLATPDDLARVVARLTAWTLERLGDAYGDEPVSGGLAPMGLAERAELAATAHDLVSRVSDPAQRADLETALQRRLAELREEGGTVRQGPD